MTHGPIPPATGDLTPGAVKECAPGEGRSLFVVSGDCSQGVVRAALTLDGRRLTERDQVHEFLVARTAKSLNVIECKTC